MKVSASKSTTSPSPKPMVILSDLLNWDEFAKIYGKNFSSTMGNPSVNARIIIGALIIKHIERKDDRGTIQMISENLYYLKERNIRYTRIPFGHKPKVGILKTEKQKLIKEKNERNQIESKFGQGKSRYNLNKIMAKLQDTSRSWIAAIFFVMNILKLSNDFLCQFFYSLFFSLFWQNLNLKNQSKSIQVFNQILKKILFQQTLFIFIN